MKLAQLKATAEAQGLEYGRSKGVQTDNVGNILEGLFDERVADILCLKENGYLQDGIKEEEGGEYLVAVAAPNSLRRTFLAEELEGLKATMAEGLVSFYTSLLSAFSYLSREIEASESLRNEEIEGIYTALNNK